MNLKTKRKDMSKSWDFANSAGKEESPGKARRKTEAFRTQLLQANIRETHLQYCIFFVTEF